MKLSFPTISLFCLLGVIPISAHSQIVNHDTTKYFKAKILKPQAFDFWIADIDEKVSFNFNINSDSIQSVVVSRISEGHFTTEMAVFKGLSIVAKIELSTLRPSSYDKTINYIDSILEVLYGQEIIAIKLLKAKSMYLKNGRPPKDGRNKDTLLITVYTELLSAIESINFELNYLETNCHFDLGEVLFKNLNNKIEAEKHFVIAQTYPFWILRNSEYLNKHREIYLKAGRRRLETNRGNLKALERLGFIPAASDLYPVWRHYIEEVGGNWEELFGDD